jgi:hypothetical protein
MWFQCVQFFSASKTDCDQMRFAGFFFQGHEWNWRRLEEGGHRPVPAAARLVGTQHLRRIGQMQNRNYRGNSHTKQISFALCIAHLSNLGALPIHPLCSTNLWWLRAISSTPMRPPRETLNPSQSGAYLLQCSSCVAPSVPTGSCKRETIERANPIWIKRLPLISLCTRRFN